MPTHPSLPDLLWDTRESPAVVRLTGDWTLIHYPRLHHLVERSRDAAPVHRDAGVSAPWRIDLSGITNLDTAGAERVCALLGPALHPYIEHPDCQLDAARKALLGTVLQANGEIAVADIAPRPSAARELLGRIGASVMEIAAKTRDLLGFSGITLQALAVNLLQPARWRPTALVAQIEQCALNAVPIVALLTFLVGAVVAFLGATVLAGFGASIYTVHLVAFSFLREFAVLLAAILVAGRTASAFTAQIGSMKANEEIDAIRMLGLNPVDILVIPRVLALLVSLPILTFVGMVSGIAGGAFICAVSLDISPTMFLSMLHDRIPLRHFLLGMSKAPIFAFFIAIIGCMEGFRVSGSAESVGRHTTSAVVQSIFVVILLDALAALFFMEMGW